MLFTWTQSGNLSEYKHPSSTLTKKVFIGCISALYSIDSLLETCWDYFDSFVQFMNNEESAMIDETGNV